MCKCQSNIISENTLYSVSFNLAKISLGVLIHSESKTRLVIAINEEDAVRKVRNHYYDKQGEIEIMVMACEATSVLE